MSHAFFCRQCSFKFASGWSHHSGTCALICRHCGERFFAKSNRSVWGPSLNEHLPIYHERYVSKRKGIVAEPLGMDLVAIEIPDQKGVFKMEPESLRCPCCHTDEAVWGTLRNGDVCPQCRTGTIIDEGFIEH